MGEVNIYMCGPPAGGGGSLSPVTVTQVGGAPITMTVIPPFGVQVGSTLYAATAPSIEGLDLSSGAGYEELTMDIGGVNGLFKVPGADLTDLALPDLVVVNGAFEVSSSATLATLDLSSLQYVSGGLLIQGSSLTTLDLGELVSTGAGDLQIEDSGSLATIDLGSLTSALGLSIYNSGLSALNVPNLTHINFNGIDVSGSTSLAGVNISGLLAVFGEVYFSGCALPQSEVDEILVKFAALDGTAGTTAFSGSYIDLTGGTNASPSATGLTAKTTLEGRGNTVDVN